MTGQSPSSVTPQPVVGIGIGSHVGGYRLEEQVGAGGMAVVFRARDEQLGRVVAVKILSPALAADETFRRRFVRESRAAAAVDDPHIIPVFAAGEDKGLLYIAMRFVPGGDVRSLLQGKASLEPRRAASIVSAVASALDAAHAIGLVHRDVKPANMLIDVRPGRPDHVYLSDFGLSKGELSANPLTTSGQFLGTPGYAAPEQMAGKRSDGRADQYALACAAFELLAGEPPFPRDEVTAVIWAHMSESPPLVTHRRPGLPTEVDRVLAKGLAKAPADRYGSCGAFAEELREALGLAPYDAGSRKADPAGPADQDGTMRFAGNSEMREEAKARTPWLLDPLPARQSGRPLNGASLRERRTRAPVQHRRVRRMSSSVRRQRVQHWRETSFLITVALLLVGIAAGAAAYFSQDHGGSPTSQGRSGHSKRTKSTLPTIPTAFIGTWRGRVKQQVPGSSSTEDWTASVTLAGGTDGGSVSYVRVSRGVPDCSGTLSPKRATTATLDMTQEITKGNCGSGNGTVTITITGPGKVRFVLSVGSLSTSGTLTTTNS